MRRKGFEVRSTNDYATLTKKTDVKPSAHLLSAYVATDLNQSDPLQYS